MRMCDALLDPVAGPLSASQGPQTHTQGCRAEGKVKMGRVLEDEIVTLR